ncbi:MAG: metallophosphoesterase family protein [Saprospiraceae bacterium]|nr:metallophosphoesterase family protein [Saprospiraceae bacterium]
MRQFVIGDVHGCNVSLLALLKKIDMQLDDELYFLGDYVDRGQDSKGVFDTIFGLIEAGYKVVCLMGNHEAMLLGAMGNIADQYFWKQHGGKQTLKSFGTDEIYDIPVLYIDFIKNMPIVMEVGDYILVHGGLNFNQIDPLKPSQQMIWIRDWYEKINYEWLGKRIIVHGHTPQSYRITQEQLQNIEDDRVLNIDCGCVFDKHPLPRLACFELNSRQLYIQANIEK